MSTRDKPDPSPNMRDRLLRPGAVVAQVTLVVLVATALTLSRVDVSVTSPPVSENPTPLGYTWSLVLFILPFLYLVAWFRLHPEYTIQRKAFTTTLLILLPLGFGLDFLFAHTFFTFENTGAVTGIEIPGRGGGIPIEEFLFYLTGFLFVLLLYIWADEVWMERYNRPYTDAEFQKVGKLLQFHQESIFFALGLLVVAVIYKRFFAADPTGFPWYWTYLLAVSFVPSAGLYRSVRSFINWRAFSFTFLLTLLISLLWEASLASPYQWWGYQSDTMMGLFINAWSQLPVEAVFVWLAVTYTTVILYEVVTMWQVSGKSLKCALFGDG